MDGVAVALNVHPPLLLAFGGVLVYAASRAAVDAVTRLDDPSPAAMALAHWMPIAIVALLGAACGHAEIGLGVAFSTSVSLLSLDLGVFSFMSRPMTRLFGSLAPASPDATIRAFVAPAALFTTMAGFQGILTWAHAAMLLLLGALVGWMTLGKANGASHESPAPLDTPLPRRVIELVLGIALALVGGWIMLLGTLKADAELRVVTTGVVAVVILSPVLTLPVLGTGAVAVHHGKLSRVHSILAAMTLLNLCLLVPAIVLTRYARDIAILHHAGFDTWQAIRPHLRAVPFPIAVWRVDSVLLVVLGLLLIPVSLGRLVIGKMEGIGLVVLYAAYLIMSTLAIGAG